MINESLDSTQRRRSSSRPAASSRRLERPSPSSGREAGRPAAVRRGAYASRSFRTGLPDPRVMPRSLDRGTACELRHRPPSSPGRSSRDTCWAATGPGRTDGPPPYHEPILPTRTSRSEQARDLVALGARLLERGQIRAEERRISAWPRLEVAPRRPALEGAIGAVPVDDVRHGRGEAADGRLGDRPGTFETS